MQIETCVNVSDEALFGNIFTNSRLPLKWVKEIPQHDGHAVIVGGGPSVKDWIEEIRMRQSNGQTIFALNGAAKMLFEHGIDVDHQIILDARESNESFVNYAKHYYLASQCHPNVLHGLPEVTLWHQHYPDNMEQFEASIPEYDDDYALIGGGTTVGLSALPLVYTLGYRYMHLYGYDSSFVDGQTHAYAQTDPQTVVCQVTVAGRTFDTTLAMAQQAELFPKISDLLLDLGCTITIRGDGLLPYTSKMSSLMDVRWQEPREKQPFDTEASKYEYMWNIPEYSHYSPGEQIAQTFLDIVKPDDQHLIVDFGCGTGRGGLYLHRGGYSVMLLDFTENSRDEEAKELPFFKGDLLQPIPIIADYGFCTDVMEHMQPENVNKAILNMLSCCRGVFFQICLVEDNFGRLIGEPLHLTVKPFFWWLQKFESLGYVVEWSRDDGDTALFYVTYRPLGKGNK